ncbi:CAP domain-containing protein [Streptacidiphilus carbonis]|jgi:uncharacterized protein YkwD|uniref:CAP domain-containing protein n=1 Tax=Streptacidiphilus carbonis TaxID=105422 RepID=UPI000693E5C6|nr:CAP domain-containing protein [Streptacidiphilus carbonis]
MSSSRRARPHNSRSGQHRSRRKPRFRLALTGAAALAVIGGGTAFACMDVPQVSAAFGVGSGHGTHHAGGSGAAGASARPSRTAAAPAMATIAPARGKPSVHPTAKPSGKSSARPSASPSAHPDARPTTAAPTTAAPASAPTATSTTAANGDAVQQVLALINRARAAAGLSPYTLTAGLNASAAAHNKVMASGCGLSHQCPGEPAFGDRENAAGVQWTSAGENIGEGGGVDSSDAAIATSAVGLTQMMLDEKAPDDGHRKNILSSSFTRVGIAVYRDSSGTVWLTQDFAN